jgi:hypothetical protein
MKAKELHKVFEMLDSLSTSVNEAGGAIELHPEALMKESVWEFIQKLAPNGIRFYFDHKANPRIDKLYMEEGPRPPKILCTGRMYRGDGEHVACGECVSCLFYNRKKGDDSLGDMRE